MTTRTYRDPSAGRDGARSTTTAWAAGRLAYLDNLKVVLIAAIIVMHAFLGYAGLVEVWTYSGVREVTLLPAVEIGLYVLVGPFAFFLMALLFLVAGLLTPASYDHHGARGFVAVRLLRLGVPFVVYVALVQPTVVYALEHPWGNAPGSFGEEYLGREGQLDTGPLWFVGVLLVFSLSYAAWRGLRQATARHAQPSGARARLTATTLAGVALAVAPLSFAVRMEYPYGSESGFFDLNYWEWPVCLAMFGLGTVAAGEGWHSTVPDGLARRCRTIALCAVVAMAALLVTAGATDSIEDLGGGARWPAAGFAVVEGALTVFGSVWLLSVAQRRLARRFRGGTTLGRSAYGAFMVQTVFLVATAAALRTVDLPAEVKATTVAVVALVASFATAWLLVTKVPGASRVL